MPELPWLLTDSRTSPDEDLTRDIGREEVARVVLQKLDLQTGLPIWEATLPEASTATISNVNTSTQIADPDVTTTGDVLFDEWRHPVVAEYGGVTRVAVGAYMHASGKSMLYQVVDSGETHGGRVVTASAFPAVVHDKGLRVVGISPAGHWLCHSYRRLFLVSTAGAIVASLDYVNVDGTVPLFGLMRVIAFGPAGVTAATGARIPLVSPTDNAVDIRAADWALSGWTQCFTDEPSGPWLLYEGQIGFAEHIPHWCLPVTGHDGFVSRTNESNCVAVEGGITEGVEFGFLIPRGTRRDDGDAWLVRTYDTNGFPPYYANDGVMRIAKDGSSAVNTEFPVGFSHGSTAYNGFWWADSEAYYHTKNVDDEFEKRTIDGDPEWVIDFDSDSVINSFGKADGVIILSGSIALPSLPGLCVGVLALDDSDGSVLWYIQKPITVAAMPSGSHPTLSHIDEATGTRYGSGARSKFGQGMVATVYGGAVYATSRLYFPQCLVD